MPETPFGYAGAGVAGYVWCNVCFRGYRVDQVQADDAHNTRCAYYPDCEGLRPTNEVPWQEFRRWNPDVPHQPEWGVRYYGKRHFGGWIINLRSQRVREGQNNPAGWLPMAWLERHEGGSVIERSLDSDRVVATEYEANRLALQMAVPWIDESG